MERKKRATFQKTIRMNKKEAEHNWFVLDAAGKTLGRLAAEIARILIGKHKVTYSPGVDLGDGVIVINADKVVVTGNKKVQKLYRYYTGYIGGLREIPYETILARKPGYIIEHAVKGMMPKNRITRRQMKRLRCFAGDKHAMDSLKPIEVNV